MYTVSETDDNFSVYIHQNKINGKRYVGITGRSPSERWSGGNGYYRNKHFYSSIQLYGWDAFEHVVVASGISEEAACNMERELIQKYNTTDPQFGYNHDYGGSGVGKLTEETKQKLSKMHTGMRLSEETKNKIREKRLGPKNPNYGKHLPEETRKKISEANKGKKLSQEQKDKIGKDHSIETHQYDKSGKYIATFPSAHEAERSLNIDADCIQHCCTGLHKTAGGYIWRYSNDQFVSGCDLPQEEVLKARRFNVIEQYDMDGNLVNVYESANEAERQTGGGRHYIMDACRGKRETYRGYKWKFA